MMGDMNWHAHCGIFTYPVRVAVQHRIPLIIWGEHGFTDLAGMYSLNDRVEMTAKYRLEHAQRGYDWHDMVEETEGLTAQDLLWARYPSDEELAEVGVRGIYLGNYVNWEANAQTDVMVNEWGFEPSPGAVRAHLPPHVEPRRHARERHPRLPQVRQVRLRPRHRPLVQGRPRRAHEPRRGDRDGRALRPRQAAQATSSAGSSTSA